MKTNASFFVVVAWLAQAIHSAGQGSAFTYQGRLNDAGAPASGIYDLRFTIYDLGTNGVAVSGGITNAATGVTNGLFTVTLDFGSAVFTGAERWLEIAVRTNGATSFATLAPRQPISSTPYAITAGNVTGPLSSSALSGIYSNAVTFSNAANQFIGTFTGNGGGLSNVNAQMLGGLGSSGFWKVRGNNVAPGDFLGSTNNQPVEIRVNGQKAMRYEPTFDAPNLIGGWISNYVQPGLEGVTIGGGGSAVLFNGSPQPNVVTNNGYYATIAGGYNNTVHGYGGVVVGGSVNTVVGDFGLIGGGQFHSIDSNAIFSVIGGGQFHLIDLNAAYSIIGGGFANIIETNAQGAFIGGGGVNTIKRDTFVSSIGGGYGNTNASAYGIIGGGNLNLIEANNRATAIVGGEGNIIRENVYWGFIGGGNFNEIQPGSGYSFIGSGDHNSIQTSSGFSVIGGGQGNTMKTNAPFSVIGGGLFNSIEPFADQSVVVGGNGDRILSGARESFIGGGFANTIQNGAAFSFIGAGTGNTIGTNSTWGTIAGGQDNIIQPDASYAIIGGGLRNNVGGFQSTIGGGRLNSISANANWATIGGGDRNVVSPNTTATFIGGGARNTVESIVTYGTIAGGWSNSIGFNLNQPTIGGGFANAIQTGGDYSFIGGGALNTNHGFVSLVAGGRNNTILPFADHSVISGGRGNRITGSQLEVYATIGGGQGNTVLTNAPYGTIPGGFSNAASAYSFAAGNRAKAIHQGSFVWADSTNADFSTTSSNQFLIRASGGVGIGTTNPTTALEVVGLVKAGGFMDNGSGFTGTGSGLTNVNAATFGGLAPSNYWRLTGNNVAAGQFLGSTNNQAVEIRANGSRALRIEPTASGSPNIIAGANVNAIASGVSGATVSGGLMNMIGGGSGFAKVGGGQINVIDVDSHESTIGGGYRNTIQTFDSTIAGGASNTIETNSSYSTIGGGIANRVQAGAQISTVAGGVGNVVETNATNSTISGGVLNRVGRSARVATIGGGENNRADAVRTTVSGGSGNSVETNASASTIGGGMMNLIMEGAQFGTIGGGNGSAIENSAVGGTIGGGQGNRIGENAISSVVAGGGANGIGRDSLASVISGGGQNEIDIATDFATIGGGEGNRIADQAKWSSVGGGYGNFVQFGTRYGTISGGRENQVWFNADTATIGGGSNNFVLAAGGTVGGGRVNFSQGFSATVPGGENNEANGDYSFAAGRRAKANHQGGFVWADSQNSDFFSTGNNQFAVRAAGGCFFDSLIGIGTSSPGVQLDVLAAQGTGRFTATNAVNGAVLVLRNISPSFNYLGAINFENSGGTPGQIGYLTNDTMIFRAGGVQRVSLDGGGNLSFGSATRQMLNLWGTQYGIGIQSATMYFRSDNFTPDGGFAWYRGGTHNDGQLNAGGGSQLMRLNPLGLWVNGAFLGASDRNLKAGFESVDPKAVLEKVAALPITRWHYTNDSATTHLGPVAQDFHAAFGVGANDKTIATVDADGVALAAIQGLNQKLEETRADLKRRDIENAELKQRLAALEKLVSSLAQTR